MTIAVSSARTMAGARRIAAQRMERLHADRQGLPAKIAPVASGGVLKFPTFHSAYQPMRIPSSTEVARARHLAFLADLEILDRTPARVIIERVAELHRMTAGDILDQGRSRKYIEARFDAIAAVRLAYPEKSTPWLGRLFHRDHTSILHALEKRGVR